MKQHITVKQLDELSGKGKKRLREWWNPNDIDLCYQSGYGLGVKIVGTLNDFRKHDVLPLLSIGQMIEFLGDNTNDWGIHYQDTTCTWSIYYGYFLDSTRFSFTNEVLVNALWEAVKEILNE